MDAAVETLNIRASIHKLGAFLQRKIEGRSTQAFDILLFGTVVTLTAVGLIMVYSSGFVTALKDFNNSLFFFQKQFISCMVGIVFLLFFMNFDYRNLKILAVPILVLSYVLLFIVLIPGLGRSNYGAQRWLVVGSLSFQPSEYAKLAVIIFMASFLSNKSRDPRSFRKFVMPGLVITATMAALIMAQPDLSTAVSVSVLVFVLLFLARAQIRHLLITGGVGMVSVFILIITEGYRLRRFLAFLDPWKDMRKDGYHIIQSLLAISGGGLSGVGLGKSIQKFLYLPKQYNDFIFAIITEELGILGALCIIALFVLFLWRGLKTAMDAPDRFGGLLAGGLVAMVVIQAILNIGVVLSFFPTTGLPLPFISFGGSSLVINLCAAGILLNISRRRITKQRKLKKRRISPAA